jgi:hypothetical protein
MWRSDFTIPHSFAAYVCRLYLPPTFAACTCRLCFAAYICRPHLPPIFAAYICRLCLTPIFWTSAYILKVRLHFEQAPIFYACANILSRRQYFDDFCNEFWLIFLLQIFVYIFSILFMRFCVRQYFWRNCFEA